MPSGGEFPRIMTSLNNPPTSKTGPAPVLTGDSLHLFNLAAAYANIAGTLIMPEDLLLALLAAQIGSRFSALTALSLDPVELYRQLYQGKSLASPVKSA